MQNSRIITDKIKIINKSPTVYFLRIGWNDPTYAWEYCTNATRGFLVRPSSVRLVALGLAEVTSLAMSLAVTVTIFFSMGLASPACSFERHATLGVFVKIEHRDVGRHLNFTVAGRFGKAVAEVVIGALVDHLEAFGV